MSTPPTSTPWVPVWPLGAASAGANLIYKGDYVAGTYNDGDAVVKDGVVFMCVGGPTTVAPDAAIWGAPALAAVAYSTSLPTSPVDGQEAVLVDSLTAPTYQWRFRYNAYSAHADKWEFIGGAPWVGVVTSTDTTPSINTWINLPNGPTLAAPRAGIYDLRIVIRLNNNSANDNVWICTSVQGIGDSWPVTMPVVSATSPSVTSEGRSVRAAVGNVLGAKSYCSNAGTQFLSRQLTITPVRVS